MLLPYPYPPRVRALLLFLALALAAAGLFLRHPATLDVCVLRRELNERPSPSSLLFFLPTIPLRDSPLNALTVLLIWACTLTLSLAPVKPKVRSGDTSRVAALHAVAFAAVWFHTTYILLAALKALVADYNCAGRHVLYPNGISGHYCYFVFCVLGLPCLAYMRMSSSFRSSSSARGTNVDTDAASDISNRGNPATTNNPSPSSSSSASSSTISTFVARLVLLLQSLVLSGAFATLYRTFFHGYHSLRQVFLGVALGMVSHLALDAVHFQSDPWRFAPHKLVILAANTLVAAALYLRLWPVNQAGQAITQMHVLFHACAWGCVAATGLAMAGDSRVGVAGRRKKTAMD